MLKFLKAVGVNIPEIDDHEMSEGFEVNRQVIITMTDHFLIYYISNVCFSVA